LLGVVVLGGLALGVSALAAPRGADQPASRGGKDKVGTELTQLVTGDAAQINAVVAGTPPTAIWEVSPVAAKVGAQAYTISGSSISAANGGFRAWFEAKFSNWDPNGDSSPGLHAGQLKLDASGYMSGNGDALDRAVVPCSGTLAAANAICAAAFGESFAKCDLDALSATFQTCNAGYNKGDLRSDSICDANAGGCDSEDTSTANLNYLWFWVNSAANRIEDQGPGFKYYVGTLVLDVPAGARGTYCVGVNPDIAETFFADATPTKFDSAQFNGFCVVIETGSCCYGLGAVNPTGDPAISGCTDKQKAKECGITSPPHSSGRRARPAPRAAWNASTTRVAMTATRARPKRATRIWAFAFVVVSAPGIRQRSAATAPVRPPTSPHSMTATHARPIVAPAARLGRAPRRTPPTGLPNILPPRARATTGTPARRPINATA
jgi:hypothetical protein